MSYRLTDMRLISEHAGNPDWSPNGELIAFDGAGPDSYYDIYTIRPDGSDRRCLTCDKTGLLPQRHNGTPAWHPSGEYIVFQVEKDQHPGDSMAAHPGAGYFCDLWVMSADAERFWQLTDIDANKAQGVLHAHFSPDGQYLAWGERVQHVGRGPDDLGIWAVKVARFITDPEPRIEDIRTYQPGAQTSWYEVHSFSPDGRTLYISGDLEPDQSIAGMDVYALDLATGETTNLTSSMREWDEHAHISPDGEKIVWMTNKGLDQQWTTFRTFITWLKTELWMMNADGTGMERVTYFNEPGHPHSEGRRAIASRSSWSPDGRSLALLVNLLEPGPWEERLYLLTFE